MIGRVLALAYGVACYLIFLGVFLYSILWLGNIIVPNSIDAGSSSNTILAVAIDFMLLGIFAIQHSVMARPAFKRLWTRVVPECVERSTYVMASNLAMILVFAFWQPIPGQLWTVESTFMRTVIYAIFFAGWGLIFYSTCLINHFDLFGLRQVWLYFRGKEYTAPAFRVPGAYRVVRHPLYVGWITVFWAAPTMGLAHWVFALGCTAYILVAIQFEERDLEVHFGDSYREYRRSVPMLLPRRARRAQAMQKMG